MSRVSSINKKHIHSLYVHRRTVVSGTSTVDGVSPVRKTENNPFYSEGNYLYYSDTFYEHLQQFEEAYHNYYTQSNRLSKLTKFIENENQAVAIPFDKLPKLLELLTREYNRAITSLKIMEEESSILLSLKISGLLLQEQDFLGFLGITVQDNMTCRFRPWIFHANYHYQREKVRFLVTHKSDLLQKLSDLFNSLSLDLENLTGYQSLNQDREQGVLLDHRT